MHSNQEFSAASTKTSTFIYKKRKNKKLCIFTKEPYFNAHTINMVYSAILKLLFAMIFRNHLILIKFEGSKFQFPPLLSSMTHLFSTLNYPNITTFKQVSQRFLLDKLLNRFFCGDLKCIHCQCILRHYSNRTIHGAICDKYNHIEILVSDIENLSSLWDRGQFIVFLLHTRIIKNTFFVGRKNEKIRGLKILLTQITQWFDYIEEVTRVTNV